ncbi:hypothetical protein THAOC_02227 [Thalassiosira oceanica]|uniref:Uncharacterized protein n=1 Tax=Thalassiosira oceanica TaxID=159749 RepID=K0TB69_THAOC|nr:hypothetical protein THAOC_02227 [Thalassiosira oceanica]|eukprot:EJK76028.1 hypothetical protein THAOC_02227 [Thalassiosira oceanica]
MRAQEKEGGKGPTRRLHDDEAEVLQVIRKAEVSLDNSIYPGGPPPDFAGRLFTIIRHVVKYNGEDNASGEDAVYVLRYKGKCIMPALMATPGRLTEQPRPAQ